MNTYHSKVEILLQGGKPWGFAIKGGTENNKPLVISRVEEEGKAFIGGLSLGDVLFSINNVPLSGSRDEAIRLVKMSQYTLRLQVERSLSEHCTYFQNVNNLTNIHKNQQSQNSEMKNFLTDSQINQYTDENLSSANQTSKLYDSFNTNPTTEDAVKVAAGGAVSPSTPSLDDNHNNYKQQPVKRRNLRKRETNLLSSERPRSWHASKHTEAELNPSLSQITMRSPYNPNPLTSKRRSKGWMESGDLQSTYTSRDSLLSSNTSISRLSLSSSGLSSERMSASRSSLENLDNVSVTSSQLRSSHRATRNSRINTAGIVTKNKSMFEQLCQQGNFRQHRGSQDQLDKIEIAHRRHQSNIEDDVINSRANGYITRKTYSPTSSTVRTSGSEIEPRRSGTEYKYADAKIVKTSTLERRQPSTTSPDPPIRDSSIERYKMRIKSRSTSSSREDDPSSRRVSSSSHEIVARAVNDKKQAFVKAIEKSIEGSSGRQERIFGVVSNSPSYISSSSSPADSYRSVHESNDSPNGSSKHPVRFERLKECYTPLSSNAGRVYTINMDNEFQNKQETAKSNEEDTKAFYKAARNHLRSASIDSFDSSSEVSAKGRYGAVWKAPNSHSRSKSIDSTLSEGTHLPEDDNKKENFTCSSKDNNEGGKQDYEMIWLTSTHKSPKTASQTELDKRANVMDRKIARSLTSNNWKDYKSSELDVQNDDPFVLSPSDHTYSNHIKYISNKVLSKTSFTRKENNFPTQKIKEKCKRFQQPLNEKKAQAVYFHARSKSQGNELDVDFNPAKITPKSPTDTKDSSPEQNRPKSAGFTKSRNSPNRPSFRLSTQNPSVRTPYSNSIEYSNRLKKAGSLPRNALQSQSGASTNSLKSQHSPQTLDQNRRILIDVKPELASPLQRNESNHQVLLNYIKKQKLSTSSCNHSSYKSPSTSSVISENKPQSRTSDEGIGSSSVSVKSSSPSEGSQRVSSNHRKHSVRKSANYQESRERFNQMSDLPRRKSSTNITESPRRLKAFGRASSMDDLLKDGENRLSVRYKSNINLSRPSNKSSISGLQLRYNLEEEQKQQEETKVEPPPRLKHRSRNSNSTVSSTTTASTLSSLSSTSSTSIITFPAVIDEEQPPSLGHVVDNRIKPEFRSPTNIDSRTYKVKKVRSRRNPQSDLESDPKLDQKSDPRSEPKIEDEKSPKKDETPPPPPPDLPDIPSDQTKRAAEIVEKVKKSSSFRIQAPRDHPLTPPPTSKPLDEAGERLLRKISMKKERQTSERIPTESEEKEISLKVEINQKSNEIEDEDQNKPQIKISSKPLLPDLTLPSNHIQPTEDISTNQSFPAKNKEALDYMTGLFSQPSHDVIEEGMRYRMRKPNHRDSICTEDETKTNRQDCRDVTNKKNDVTHTEPLDELPATSTYYKTSASKAKIMNLVQEKIDLKVDDTDGSEAESVEELNKKKFELVVSLNKKIKELTEMKQLLDNEKRENENLGSQVNKVVKEICSSREYDKYISFVGEVDNIIKLLISLSGRLARVENALLIHQHESPERAPLMDKKRILQEQHKEAKLLKKEIDLKQQRISETLAKNFNQEQFADYEHYIQMKSALIVEQREFDDKINLGEEQMQCLKDALPDHMLAQLDDL